MTDILDFLARASVEAAPVASLGAWLDRLAESPFAPTVERAAWAGFHADRVGYAFAGGYEAALRRLVGAAPGSARRCLAATESGGAHPRAIATTLAGGVLRGEKTFATLASIADELLVVASTGVSADGKNALVLVRIPKDATGLTIADRPPTPFAPEIPHATVTLDGVPVAPEAVLPGDGYTRYLRPFRTIEDIHVLAACLGLFVRVARRGAATALAEQLLALVLTLRALGERDPSDPAAHVALAGAFSTARGLFDASEAAFRAVGEDDHARFLRDRPLLGIAGGARHKRTETAWKALS